MTSSFVVSRDVIDIEVSLRNFTEKVAESQRLSISNSHLGVVYLLSKLYLFNSVHLYIITFTRTFTFHSLTCKRF